MLSLFALIVSLGALFYSVVQRVRLNEVVENLLRENAELRSELARLSRGEEP